MPEGAANHSTSGDASPGDGRNVDPARAQLVGEAAGLSVPDDRTEGNGAAPFDVWRLGSHVGQHQRDGVEAVRGPTDADATPAGEPTYYDLPVVKEPVWVWAVPAYFF